MRKIYQIILSIIVSIFITATSVTPISAATTTTQKYCTNNNNHSMSCGNMEKWFNNKKEIELYLKEIDNNYSRKYENFSIFVLSRIIIINFL